MALSDEDKKEVIELHAQGFLEGFKRLRAQLEEEDAKKPKPEPEKVTNDNGGSGPVDLAGFILGRR